MGSRYGTESALQIQWAAKRLQPQRFNDLDTRSPSPAILSALFDYSLTGSEAERILQAPPQVKWAAKQRLSASCWPPVSWSFTSGNPSATLRRNQRIQ